MGAECLSRRQCRAVSLAAAASPGVAATLLSRVSAAPLTLSGASIVERWGPNVALRAAPQLSKRQPDLKTSGHHRLYDVFTFTHLHHLAASSLKIRHHAYVRSHS
jgi:hypothetical protein